METPVEEAEEEVPADTGEVTAAEISYPPGLEVLDFRKKVNKTIKIASNSMIFYKIKTTNTDWSGGFRVQDEG